MSDFGITGIGNPYMSGLGAFGLGAGSAYGSYGNPSMMMGMGSMGMMGFPGGMGMMGMYNPAFMSQMNQTYQDMEKSQLQHASAMHELLLQNKTNAYRAEDQALFQKSMEDANINGQVVNLAEKIREGDADGICEEFDKLKIALYQKHNDYLKANADRLDPTESVHNIIETLYAQIISKKTGEQVSLRSDIKRYGETAFMHGFNKDFFGKKDYHGKYTEETLSYLFGTRIDNKGGKDRMENIGSYAGKAAEAAVALPAGYVAGLGLAGLGTFFSSMFTSKVCEKVTLSGMHKFGKWAALAALAGDILWQCARD